ncbi:hypothetical protein [Solidesulfovibrio sp.]|uniref:hypothetical protein n=1 Tax=Solidesulfovibrio sp. TaxID=2910990 RepID=UPI002601FD71|nr:hypothetical protein [Solidesulfovibrio sp.]
MHCRIMLTYEQIKAIENALGVDAAKPVVEAIQSTDQRVLSSLLAEIATKADLEKLRGETREEIASLRGDIKRLDLQMKLLIALAVLAIAMFSPNLAALVRLAK